MIRRSWSHLFASTALVVGLTGVAWAQDKAAAPETSAASAESSASSPARSEVADTATPAAPSAADIAGKLSNPVQMPTEAPNFAAAPAPEPAFVVIPAKPPAPVAATAPAVPVTAVPAPVAATSAPVATTGTVASTTAPAPVVPAPIVPAGPTLAELAKALEAALDKPEQTRATAEERKLRTAIAEFYATRAFEPIFVDLDGPAAKARQAAQRFAKAAEDGLDPAAYAVEAPRRTAGLDALAALELDFAESAVRYATHAQTGRFEPTRVHPLVTAKPEAVDPAAVLAKLAAAPDVSVALAAYNPPHEGYRRLKAKLAEMGGFQPPPQVVQVPMGPVLKPGQKDGRVAALRERLQTGAGTVSDAELYDDSLVEAVKAFQRDRGIKPTGLVGPATVIALNDAGPVGGRAAEPTAADIVANMERWRWLPRDLGSLHVFVNIPDFHLNIVHDGKSIHRTRVIVGKVQNQTPVFSETMTHIIVNPYWNVPVSILKKEMMGRIQETGGGYLQRGNYEVLIGKRVVDATSVDWSSVNPAAVHVRQRPGAGNALGNVKFMFPNEHSVYLHDTSSRGLFSQSYRALSHGCVRVHEPFAFADALLSEEPGDIDGKKLKGMIGGGGERYIWLKRKLDVHLAYFTAFVDDDGKLESRADVYGHNQRTRRLLGL